jgi:hypothetical protein
MLLLILMVWTGLSVACALAVGRFFASLDRRWLSEELHSGAKNPSVEVEIPYTMSAEPRQMAVQASTR